MSPSSNNGSTADDDAGLTRILHPETSAGYTSSSALVAFGSSYGRNQIVDGVECIKENHCT
jgi:hypothetical protein